MYDQLKGQIAFVPDSSMQEGLPYVSGDLEKEEMKAEASRQLSAAFPMGGSPDLDYVGVVERKNIKVLVYHWRSYLFVRGRVPGQSGAALMVFDDAGFLAESPNVNLGTALAHEILHALVLDTSLMNRLHSEGFSLPGQRPSVGFRNLLRSIDASIDVSQYPDV